MGVHHAWGRTLKDLYQRYKSMNGHQLRYQNGFDCQGLWVEIEVQQKKQGFKKETLSHALDVKRFIVQKIFFLRCQSLMMNQKYYFLSNVVLHQDLLLLQDNFYTIAIIPLFL